MVTPPEIKARIPHTWPLLFARHGHFTPVQQQAIPPILAGRDTLVIAATASGKTEAVIAPLLENNWPAATTAPVPLHILYICPTRALVRDLFERLQGMLAGTAVTVGMKTGDVTLAQTPMILLTTPESTDSLLTRAPKMFLSLQAIILDEIHLFDKSPRGDQLRCLLPRLEWIRQYERPDLPACQRVALSATVADPAGIADRYLQDGVIVAVPGGRQIEADIRPLYSLVELIEALGQRASYKSLIFCNSREEVEETAITLRQQLPHHAEIFVHYSNLDAVRRREVEAQFAAAATAVCVCTSTLELGMDIGTIDDVVLVGAPPDLHSFSQRIGRGSRRTSSMRVLCMPRSPREWARFEALLTLAQSRSLSNGQARLYGFRPSILIQQIFSLLKQSPTGSIRLADLRRVAPPSVTSEDLRKIVSQLTFARYLQPGRLGEWKPDRALDELIDRHEIYSNIGADILGVTAVDAHTGFTIARTDKSYPQGTVLLFGGKPMKVVWTERYRFGLAPSPGAAIDDILRFQKTAAAIPFYVTQTVANVLAIPQRQMVVLPQTPGCFLFHFWGTVWGELLTSVLIECGIRAETVNEYCLYVHRPLPRLPEFSKSQLRSAVDNILMRLTNWLEMGRFHRLLPADVATAAIIRQLNLTGFTQQYRAVEVVETPQIAEQLASLAGG